MDIAPIAKPRSRAAGPPTSKAKSLPILSRRARDRYCLQSKISDPRPRSLMRKTSSFVLCIACLLLLSSCSPRDFLTRRLAADLIASSDTFQAPRQFTLRTGIVPNKDYLSSDYLVLLHRGWISGTSATCPPALGPPPCWDIMLTPSGVDTFQNLIAPGDAQKQSFSIPVLHRELVAITGIAKQR